jgi:predicted nuclease with TOPRIM domain
LKKKNFGVWIEEESFRQFTREAIKRNMKPSNLAAAVLKYALHDPKLFDAALARQAEELESAREWAVKEIDAVDSDLEREEHRSKELENENRKLTKRVDQLEKTVEKILQGSASKARTTGVEKH